MGRTTAVARSLRASQIPIGKPITRQKKTEVITSDRVTIASAQAPISPTMAMEITAPMARRRPAACQASRPISNPVLFARRQ